MEQGRSIGARQQGCSATRMAPGSRAGHVLPFTVLSPASFERIFGFIGTSVSKLYVLSGLVCAPHKILCFICGLCLPGVDRTKAQLCSSSVPAFS